MTCRGRFGRVGVAMVLAGMMSSGVVRADEIRPKPLVISAEAISRGIGAPPVRLGAPQQRASTTHPAKRTAWTAIGAAAGFFGGAYLGSWLENAIAPCGCDDPGLKGALIGMPIGAIAGGIAGFVLSK